MKKLYFLLITLLITAFSYGQVINEFEPNPPGSDNELTYSVEIKGTPNTAFSGFFLSIESDDLGNNPTAKGLVDRVNSVSGTFDANGLLVVQITDLENPSFTVVLVSDFTGTVEVTDIDTDDDGVADDVSTMGTVYDALGIPDNSGDEAFLYGSDLGGLDFVFTGEEPQLVFRDSSTGDWYAVNDVMDASIYPDVYDISANTVSTTSFDFDPIATGTTFGTANPEFTGTASVNRNEIEQFSMYPNPVEDGILKINTFENAQITVLIFDLMGKQVLSKKVENQHVNVSNLNSGIYILKVSENGKTSTRKLVIK